MNNQNQLTSLEEAINVTGENGINNIEAIQNAERLICSDASPSVARLNAWESLFAARATNLFETQIVSTPFPCGSINFCLENSPYKLNPEIIEQESDPNPNNGRIISLDVSDNNSALQSYTAIFGNPIEAVQAIFESAYNRAISKQSKTPAEATLIAQGKVFQRFKNLPATLFVDQNSNPFPDVVLRDKAFIVESIRQAIFPNAQGRFVIEPAIDGLDKTGLPSVRELLMQYTDNSDQIAMKCVCPECSYSGPVVEHVVTYSGLILKNYGSYNAQGGVIQPKCQYTKPIVNGEVNLNAFSIKQLIEAGFMPQGLCMYLMEGNKNYTPNRVAAIRDYSNSRGTIQAATKLWNGQVAITPRGYIKIGDRDANAYELYDFMLNGGVDLVKEFSDSMPVFGDNRKYTLDLVSQTISIE